MAILSGELAFGTPETSYENTVWEGSPSQTGLRNAYAAGIEKVLLEDNAFKALVKWGRELVGTDNDSSDDDGYNRFGSQIELDSFVKNRLEKYCYENGFYGLLLNDEPIAGYTENLGVVYQTIKRVGKTLGIDVYIHLNVLPADPSDMSMLGDTSVTTDRDTLYRSYVCNILEATKADRLSVDIYPFMNWGLKTGYFSMLQIFKSCCDRYGAEMSLCVQTFGGGAYRGSEMGLEEIYYQLNNAFGLGIRDIYFYTYMPDSVSTTEQDSSFINLDGSLTPIYEYVQRVVDELQNFAGTALTFEFSGMKLVYTEETQDNYHFENYFYHAPQGEKTLAFNNSYSFVALNGFEITTDIALITELYNQETGQYMYMAQNVVDPYYVKNDMNGWENTQLTVTLNFGTTCKGVLEFYNGVQKYIPLSQGVYETTLEMGNASYVIPIYYNY